MARYTPLFVQSDVMWHKALLHCSVDVTVSPATHRVHETYDRRKWKYIHNIVLVQRTCVSCVGVVESVAIAAS